MTTDRALIAVVGLVVVLAGAARFVHLDRHWYFHDEATTSLFLSGHTWADFERAASSRTVTVEELRRYQDAGANGGLVTALRHQAHANPQHPPVFYVAASIWAAAVGSSVSSLRALAAIFGLLTLPCVFWFARELFRATGPAWVAVGLTAISPFQLLYSQEAREYSLWAATTALTCAAVLYAVRTQTWSSWALYALSGVLALYTFPLALLVLGAQALFIVFCARRALRRFALAAAIVLTSYLPWAYVAASNRSAFRAGTDWTSETISFVALAKAWLITLAANIVDKRGDSGLSAEVATLFAFVVVLQLLALLFLWLRGPRTAAVFLSCLFGTSFVSLAALDLVAGGVRSTVPRFIVPAYLALAVAFGYLIFRGLESSSRAAQLGALGLAVGAVACAIGSYAEETSARVWWNQDDGAAPENRTVADAVNRRPGALLLATGGGALLELSNYVRPDTRVRLVLDGRPPRIRPGSQDVFAYGSPATAVAAKRLRRLLDSLRRRGTAVERLSPEPACCGADIRRLPDQFWRVSER